MNRRQFIRDAGVMTAVSTVLPSIMTQAADPDAVIPMAFVGCAHIHTPSFVNLLKKRSDVRVKYVWDHDEARAKMRAKELNAQVAALDDIYADSTIKAVVICSETTRHPELVFGAAKAKKHMFVEKPLGITAQESYAMAKAIEDAKLIFTTGYFMRMDPKHRFLKDEIARNAFGQITRIRGSNCHSGSLGGWFDKEWRWMADPKISGVGGFGDLGTHSLDILMWLMGDVEKVTADIKIVTSRYENCDECGEGLLKFKNGVTATLAAGWVDVANPVTLEISGTKAHAVIINDQLFYRNRDVEGANGNSPFTKLPPRIPVPLDQFVDAVAGKTGGLLVSPSEAAARVGVMEAMYKANKEKTWAVPTTA